MKNVLHKPDFTNLKPKQDGFDGEGQKFMKACRRNSKLLLVVTLSKENRILLVLFPQKRMNFGIDVI